MTTFWILRRRLLLWAPVALHKTERQNSLTKAAQLVVELRFEPRLPLSLAVSDLFYSQAGNTVDKGNLSKIKKWNVSAHNSFPTPNTACSVLSKRILRALCNPRKAEGQRQGLPLSLCCLRLAPPWSPSRPVPTQAILGEKSQNKARIFRPSREATAGETMALLRIKGAGPKLGTKA